ncbi:MAG: hypothetical protein WC551_13270 [Patescibacteria group bacterium]
MSEFIITEREGDRVLMAENQNGIVIRFRPDLQAYIVEAEADDAISTLTSDGWSTRHDFSSCHMDPKLFDSWEDAAAGFLEAAAPGAAKEEEP